MRRLSLILAGLLTAVAAACLGNVSAPKVTNYPYAIIYGRIGAPRNEFNISVDIVTYKDSAEAIRDSTSDVTGGITQAATDSTDSTFYFAAVLTTTRPVTFFVNVYATGQGHGGFVSSLDTLRGIRVRFDSIGGGPHDSIAVYDTLP